MTKNLLVLFAIFCLAFCPLGSFAAQEGEGTLKEKIEEAAADVKEAVGEAQVDVLQAMGEKMIDNRLNAIDYAENLLAAAKLVAADAKAEVGAMLSENSAGLSSLKDDILADSDAGTLKDKVKSIV